LLNTGFTILALPAGVYKTSYTSQVAHLESFNMIAHLCYTAYNFMAGYHRVNSILPLIAYLVQVGVANAAVQDLYLYIMRAWLPALQAKWA
jgi:hypothetical protein